MSAVSLKNVFKSYDATPVIHGVDLDIRDGEFIVFVGPSGCGKSTLMRMVAGLEDITAGEILIDGQVVNDLPPRDRDIAMVFQDYALYPNKTVFENMAFGLRLRKTPADRIKECVLSAAETLQISHLLERLPKALSGGQRQRVAMGRAIVRQPKVFLFDEPLSNLDALLRNQVRAEIKKLHHRLKGTTIYVTHDQVEAMTLADRIVVLRAGVIVQVGTPDEIYHQPRHRFVAGFTGSPPMNFVDAGVVANDGCPRLNLAGIHHLPLPDALLPAIQDRIGSDVEFGIRPENLHLADSATPAGWPKLPLKVELIEPMGAENLVHFALGQHEIVGRFGNTVRPAPRHADRGRHRAGKNASVRQGERHNAEPVLTIARFAPHFRPMGGQPGKPRSRIMPLGPPHHSPCTRPGADCRLFSRQPTCTLKAAVSRP